MIMKEVTGHDQHYGPIVVGGPHQIVQGFQAGSFQALLHLRGIPAGELHSQMEVGGVEQA